MNELLERAAHTCGGIQVAAYAGEELIVDAAAGVEPDALMPGLFGISKSLLYTALHLQIERGLLDEDAPIARYWPEFGKEAGTVGQVLTHRLGTPRMPAGMTPERLCDWEWTASGIAALEPIFPPGTGSSYLALAVGWIAGELVQRTDPAARPLAQFIREELCEPIGADDLWPAVPLAVWPRVVKLTPGEGSGPRISEAANELWQASMPPGVALSRYDVYNRQDVQAAGVPGVGGVANARSSARFYALLANGGTLGGVRLLSEARVRSLAQPRPGGEALDPVLGFVAPLGAGGFWLGSESSLVGIRPGLVWHPGGVSVAWAELDRRLAVAICHTRMIGPAQSLAALRPLVEAVRREAERRSASLRD